MFDANISAIEAAARFGNEEILTLLLAHATPAQRLLAAGAKADRATAEAIVASHPGLVASLRPEEMRVIADKAADNNTAAVMLMLDLGFDQRVAGHDHGAVERWANDRGGDCPATVRLLLDAGETFEPSILPTGRDDVDRALRGYLRRSSAASA